MNIVCKNIIISRLLFERNMKTIDSDEIEVSIDRSFGISKDKSMKDAKLEAKLIFGDKKQGNRGPFYCEMEIMSILQWDDISEDMIETAVSDAGMPIIISFARVKLFELCQQAGLNGPILPAFEVK